jgi:hypothetical protein
MSDDGEISVSTWVLLVLGIIIVLGALGFGIHACSVADEATLGAAEQNVRTRNFEQSEAYKAGLRRDFDELILAYAHAKSHDERATIFAVIRHRAEGCPSDQVPEDVKQLLAKGVTDP